MAILMQLEVPGLTQELYDQANTAMGDRVRQMPGFLAHAAILTESGVRIIELWASEEDSRRWLTEAVVPMSQQMGLPPLEPQFTPLHSVITP